MRLRPVKTVSLGRAHRWENGEYREVTMFALLFLLLGILFLLVAAGRIWIDATPIDSPTIDSAATDNAGESVAMDHMSERKDSAV